MSKTFSKDMGFIGLIESLLLWLMLNIYNAKNWVGGWMPQFDIGWLCPQPLNQLSADRYTVHFMKYLLVHCLSLYQNYIKSIKIRTNLIVAI